MVLIGIRRGDCIETTLVRVNKAVLPAQVAAANLLAIHISDESIVKLGLKTKWFLASRILCGYREGLTQIE